MLFDPELTNILSDALPWAGPFFRVITELGGALFFIIIILAGLWAFRKKGAIVTAFILLFSNILNYWLKVAIANPRPDQATYWYEGYEQPNYSTPSAHSQNTVALFGWFAAKARTWWMFLISAVLIFLI